MRAPVCSAVCSVDSPTSHASGTSAAADNPKSTTLLGFVARSSATVSGASASAAQRSLRATGDYPNGVLEAVLFDWGHTLMDWRWDDELFEAGHRAGLAAIGAPPEKAPLLTTRYRGEARLFDSDVPEQ